MAAIKSKYASPVPLLPDDSPLLPDLPPEIIAAVLFRLPVKSLLRLRCVCKSWRSLVSNPQFAKTHLNLSSANTDYTSHRLLLSSWYPCDGIKSCSLHSILNEKSDTSLPLDCPWKDPNGYINIWGCCAGLVCIGTKRKLCIWNPSTRKYKELPDFGTADTSSWFGFGYVECIDDYKVVGFLFGHSGMKPAVKVYTLRSDSWRKIEAYTRGIPRYCPASTTGTFVNGALHYLHWPRGSLSIPDIVSLDMVKETYGEISLPEYQLGSSSSVSLPEYRHCTSPLGVLNGRLSLLCNFSCTSFDVWVMKEYGIRGSWTKLVSILSMPDGFNPHLKYVPFCLLENGEILFDAVGHFIRYHPKDGKWSHTVIRNNSRCHTPYLYIESLVSPDFDANGGFSCKTSTKV